MNEPKQRTTKQSNAQTLEAETELQQKIAVLEVQLKQAQEQTLRAQADYQNLLRRTREEQQQLIKLASRSTMEELLEPLEHLSMTAEQLKNQVLDMVVGQLWNALRAQGLAEIEVLGKPFDVATMEVVETAADIAESEQVVVSIVKRGYTLNGQVLRHAKVVLGARVR